MRRFTICFLLPVFFSFISNAQEILENNPPSVQWYQINTDHTDIIFPEGFNTQAQRIANTLETIYLPAGKSLDTEAKRISIILQNYNTDPNGFVTQSPRRSEFYGMPPQDYSLAGIVDWYDFLAIHEYRHVVQFDKSVVGFNKLLKILFGYEVTSSMSHKAVPDWYWEGDAVNLETALTKGGRGRIPEFNILMRTNLLERGHFDYHMQYLGSFKHNIPDHYVTGHHISAYLRRKFGDSTMSKVTRDTWAIGFQPFRFSYSLKKHTGRTLIQNYNDMMDELDSIWSNQINDLQPSQYEIMNARKSKAYTSYLYPHFLSDGRIIALKGGIGDIYQFVAVEDGKKEKRIHYPGPYNTSGILSVADDKIVWNEHRYDPRWRSVIYSDIVVHDVNTSKTRKITRKGRYGSAALSPDGTKIVTVETTLESKYKLVILDVGSGKTIREFENPNNHFVVTPRWSDDGHRIIGIHQSRKGKELFITDLESNKTRILKPFSNENFGAPYLHGQWALYSSPYNGIDNIYAYDLKTDNTYQVTQSKFGAYHPIISKDGNSLLYNEFTLDGRNIALIHFDPSGWKPIALVKDRTVNYVAPLAEQEGNADILEKVPDMENKVLPYNKWGKVLNPYSWGPYITTSLYTFDIGIRSQDVLSTTLLQGGYLLNANERTGTWYGDVSYQGLFPILNFRAFSGNRATIEKTDTATYDLNWKEKGVKIGIRLPLLLTHSVYHESLDLTLNTGYTRADGYDAPFRYLDQQGDGNLIANQYILSYRRLLKTSKRDIRSKFGQTFFLQYDHTPFGGEYFGEMISLQTLLYFPGLFKHHSIRGRFGLQFQDMTVEANRYRFSSPIPFPRGYGYTPF
ncbi:hypothetical protein ACFLU5_17105 [Bacteroidota bacterium]